MTRPALLFSCLLPLLLAPGLAAAQQITFTPTEPPSVAGVADWLAAQGAVPGAVYTYGAADLDGDGRDEALVKVTEPTWCSGDMEHCRVVILRQAGDTWETHGYPYAKVFVVLETVTNGWRDIEIDGKREAKTEVAGANYAPAP